ncbi:hypothetical protein AB751O23_AL_00030 [Chlamydiales bacterium SCGC AB-751-O23]|jgi:uncharacterized protein|nr:hypothetical protein AB751O23_AL_00030 [Chlamydiales bacterium SCGC AB-751-O23]
MSDLLSIKCYKVLQTRSYTVVTLGNNDKKFAIYTEPAIGKTMQMHLTETENPRPLTHDLMNMAFSGFGIKIKKVIINDVQDTVYFARIFFEQQIGDKKEIVEIDARPSDCLTLALIKDVPVFCTKEVMEKAVAVSE